MTTQWDRFAKRNRELAQEDYGFEDNVEISTPTETYEAGVGYSTSYTSQGTFSVELSAPSSQAEGDAGGTTVTADLIAHIPDDVPDSLPDGLDEYGESGEAPARVSPEDSPLTYEVSTIDSERNGVFRVELVEVDD